MDAVLHEDGSPAEAIRERFHRTMLWNFRTGRRKPDADGIAVLHKLTEGRIAAHGWQDLPPSKRREVRHER